jgi:hypothetical protein
VKYNNYKELFTAYKNGEIEEPIILDNDCSFVYIGDEKVFQGNGRLDIDEILDAIGIPNEWC